MRAIVLLGMMASGCVSEHTERETSSELITVTITGVTDLGIHSYPAWGDYQGRTGRSFEVYGSFPSPDPGYAYRPHVYCDGKHWPAQIVPGWGPTQINVSIPNVPEEYGAGTACWFRFEVSVCSDWFNCPRSNRIYSNWYGPASSIRITALQDQGVSAGRQYYMLYGTIQGSATYATDITCEGTPTPGVVESWSTGQIAISLASSAAPRGCDLRVKGAGFSTGLGKSNAWVVRTGGSTTTVPGNIGAWFWGGYQANAGSPSYTSLLSPPRSLEYGVGALSNAGYRNTIRLFLSPHLRGASNNDTRVKASNGGTPFETHHFPDGNVYNIPDASVPTSCVDADGQPVSSFLGCAARSQEFQRAFNRMSAGATIVMTVNDAASFGELGWAMEPETCQGEPAISIPRNSSLGWLSVPANAAKVRQEYSDLAYALYQLQSGSNRIFVISNWETENQIYSNSYQYLRTRNCALPPPDPNNSDSHAPLCDVNNPPEPIAIADSNCYLAKKVAGLTEWFKLRQQGILDGMARAAAHNPPYANVRVLDSIEMASYQSTTMFRGGPLPNTLNDIVGVVKPAYVTYSAWDSTQARGSVDEDVAGIVNKLATYGNSPVTNQKPYLAFGEFGMQTPGANPQYEWRNRELVKAAYRARIPKPGTPSIGSPVTIMWQAFDNIGWKYGGEPTESCIGGPNGYCETLESSTPGWGLYYCPSDCDKLKLSPGAPLNNHDGIMSPHGAENGYSKRLRTELASYAATGKFQPQSMGLGNIVDLGLSPCPSQPTATCHYFELWGTFGSATPAPTVEVLCDGGPSIGGTLQSVVPYYQNPNGGQLNIAVPGISAGACQNGIRDGAYCTFRVYRSSSNQAPIFGPRHVCPGGQGLGIPHPQGQTFGGGCNIRC